MSKLIVLAQGKGLNPYSTGSETVRSKEEAEELAKEGLNPYSTGSETVRVITHCTYMKNVSLS